MRTFGEIFGPARAAGRDLALMHLAADWPFYDHNEAARHAHASGLEPIQALMFAAGYRAEADRYEVEGVAYA